MVDFALRYYAIGMTSDPDEAAFIALWKKEFGETHPGDVARMEAVRLLDFYERSASATTSNAASSDPSAAALSRVKPTETQN